MRNQKNTQNPQTLRRILRYIRPYWPLVALSLVLSILTVALTLYVPILTGHAVDAIAGENLVDFPDPLYLDHRHLSFHFHHSHCPMDHEPCQ